MLVEEHLYLKKVGPALLGRAAVCSWIMKTLLITSIFTDADPAALPGVYVCGDVQELSRLKADYVSAEVADTIRNLRHHIVITDRYSHTHSSREGLLWYPCYHTIDKRQLMPLSAPPQTTGQDDEARAYPARRR